MKTHPISDRFGRVALAIGGIASFAGCLPYHGCAHLGMIGLGSSPSLLRQLIILAALVIVVYLVLQSTRPSKTSPPPDWQVKESVREQLAQPGQPGATARPDSGETTPSESPGGRTENPLDVIRMRYARGEIDRETFETMKRDLGY